MRPVLRPGATLLRRDRAHLQVGTEPGRAVVLRDSPRLRAVVRVLDGVRDVDDVVAEVAADGHDVAAIRAVLDALTVAGVVVDAEPVRAALAPAEVAHQLARGEHPATAAARAADRAAARVSVEGAGALGGALADAVARLLAGAGVGALVRPDPDGAARPTAAHDRLDAAVLVGEAAASARTDELVTAGVPHLTVAVVDGTAVLGPFVLPGRTGCLRCLDAVRTDRDPAWPVLLSQVGSQVGTQVGSQRPRTHGLPAPRSPVLESALAAWSAREVLAHLAHGHVVTYGASLRFDDDLVEQARHSWPLHPRCGCALLS